VEITPVRWEELVEVVERMPVEQVEALAEVLPAVEEAVVAVTEIQVAQADPAVVIVPKRDRDMVPAAVAQGDMQGEAITMAQLDIKDIVRFGGKNKYYILVVSI
jgi:hypothetical protein